MKPLLKHVTVQLNLTHSQAVIEHAKRFNMSESEVVAAAFYDFLLDNDALARACVDHKVIEAELEADAVLNDWHQS